MRSSAPSRARSRSAGISGSYEGALGADGARSFRCGRRSRVHGRDARGTDPTLRREILESQRRLEQIRSERARLEGEIGDVRNRVRNVSEELANVERRLSASRSVVAEIQFQSDAATQSIQETTRELVQAREQLSESEAVLNRRLRDIYKMGPLHTVGVLLGASSFTDLLNRYRYLQRIASFDRSLVTRIEVIEGQLVERNDDLRQQMAELGSLRQNRLSEVAELRSVENERQEALEEFRAREQLTGSRLEQLDADEGRMTRLIVDLETRRREIEARAATATADASLSSDDAGSLDWPLDGDVIYRFGRERRPNGTVLRWNGIGISALPGSPVTAVRAGTVVLAGPFEGYGPTVVLYHGDGFYTLYLYLGGDRSRGRAQRSNGSGGRDRWRERYARGSAHRIPGSRSGERRFSASTGSAQMAGG